MKLSIYIVVVFTMQAFGMERQNEHEEIIADIERQAFNTLESKNSEDFLIYIAALPTTEQRKKLFKTACYTRLDCGNNTIDCALATAGYSIIDEHKQNLVETLDTVCLKGLLLRLKPKMVKKIGPVFNRHYSAIEIHRYYSIAYSLLCLKDPDLILSRAVISQSMHDHLNFLASENNFLQRLYEEKEWVLHIVQQQQAQSLSQSAPSINQSSSQIFRFLQSFKSSSTQTKK